MVKPSEQVIKPFSALVFDCDGTLTAIEGIDYLAKLRGVYHQVANLTQEAMGKTGLTPALYQQRLDLVQPSQADILQLGKAYCEHLMPNTAQVFAVFQALNKPIFIISAGLRFAVNTLAAHLAVPLDHVKAVDIYFDEQGTYRGFDLQSPLIHNQGKSVFVREIQKTYSSILYVGDGLNDLAVKNEVTRFVGFGGAFYREAIAKACDFYITDFAELLGLALTEDENFFIQKQRASPV